MEEVVGGIACHSDALHHALRPEVRHRGHRDDLVEAELVEPDAECGAALASDA